MSVHNWSEPMTVEEMYGDWDWDAAVELVGQSLEPRRGMAIFDTVEAAVTRALAYADGDDAILITGSLYTAGAARPVVQRYAN